MAIKTFNELVEAMRSFIRSRQPKIDTGEGTPVNDIMIQAPAQEMSALYTELQLVSEAQSIETASDTALEKIGANFGIVRKLSRRALGTVTFFTVQAPNSDITIPSGTVVGTVSSSNATAIQFATTRTAVMLAALAGTYFNPVSGRYEISVDVEALNGGLTGNVGSNTITSLVTPITGIVGVYNPSSMSGGADTESADELRSRIAAKWLGNAVGTEDGYLSVVLAQNAVAAAKVVGHGNVQRAAFGAVDIFIKGKVPRYYEETFLTTGQSVYLTKQPVLSDGIIQVTTASSGSIPTSRYTLQKDTGAYSGSNIALDTLVFYLPLTANDGTVQVAYNYNGLVEDLQGLFAATNKDVLNTNVLVRWATELAIKVSARIRILSGFSASDVQAVVSDQVSQFFSTLGIGQQVQQADVARVILNVPGVDDVVLPFDAFQSSDGSVVVNADNNLDIPQYSYASAGTLTFTVVA